MKLPKMKEVGRFFMTAPPFLLASMVEWHYDIKGAVVWWFGGIIFLAGAIGIYLGISEAEQV